MTNYDITPLGSSLPGVRLYGDSMQALPRPQSHPADAHAVQAGGPPSSGSDGVEPGRVTFEGTWLGIDASDLAGRLRDILNDTSVLRVDVQAVDDSGTDVTSPYNGEYRIATTQRDPEVAQTIPGNPLAWEYRLPLIED